MSAGKSGVDVDINLFAWICNSYVLCVIENMNCTEPIQMWQWWGAAGMLLKYFAIFEEKIDRCIEYFYKVQQ